MNTFVKSIHCAYLYLGIVSRSSIDLLCFLGCIAAVLSNYSDFIAAFMTAPVSGMFAQCSSVRLAILIFKQYIK